MKELDQILDLWTHAVNSGESAVLATVVKTRGSSYRLPGARLLLTSGGRRAGSISGGCLEEDLVKKAWWLTEAGPIIRRYDTTPDGEIAAGFGLGCNGIVHVLLERLESGSAPILELLEAVRFKRLPAAVAHLIEPSAIGNRLIVDTAGQVRANFDAGVSAPLIEEQTRAALAKQTSRTVLVDGLEVFIEVLPPPVRLLVFGAGDDAIPLTALAKHLGWRVSVFDGRAHYARREKFPHADEVFVRTAGQSGAETDPWTVAVLMSHSYSQDLEALRELAPRRLRYLGLLGPRQRTARLLEEAGIDPAGSAAVAIHSPMGLDIGADGPEQVALSVLAEIQATLNGRRGGLLRDRSGSIHAPDDAAGEGETFWVRSIVCA